MPTHPTGTELLGKAGLANARAAYKRFKETFHGERFAALLAAGAPVQRPLWASTGVKNPAYPDTMYVEELAGAETVDTMPEETIVAYQDHGDPRALLGAGLYDAKRVFEDLAAAGIDYDDVTDTLEREGVEKFSASFDELLSSLDAKRSALTPA